MVAQLAAKIYHGPSSLHLQFAMLMPASIITHSKMLGIDYPSSDEEEETAAEKPDSRLADVRNRIPLVDQYRADNCCELAVAPSAISRRSPPPLAQPLVASEPVSGPLQGPSISPPPADNDDPDDAPPGSPYTSNRAMVQTLTLPTVPNFKIPPSPPGSPPRRATSKFAQFLDLKRTGQHFNQRLEGSSVLRDPSHMQRLMKFARVQEEDLHASTLSQDAGVPVVFPPWAYVEELRASQKKLATAKEQERSKAPREAVEFVSATQSDTLSGQTSRQSTAKRTVTGSDSEQSKSKSVSKRKELEHRSRESARSGAQRTSGSRSPKRRR